MNFGLCGLPAPSKATCILFLRAAAKDNIGAAFLPACCTRMRS